MWIWHSLCFPVKEPDFSPKLLDRFLAVIEMNQIEPDHCFN